MDTPLTSIDQATPEWLTRVLQKKGFLPRCSIPKPKGTSSAYT